MQYELWLTPAAGGKLLFTSTDAGEMYLLYKDALRVYRPSDLKILVGSEWEIYEVDHRWLRKEVLRTSVRSS
jgi:hypothetical protein